jgi:integrase
MSYRGQQTPISKQCNGSIDADEAQAKPRLLDEVRNRLRLKHYSLRTEKAYLYWIRRYIHANGRRHPRELDGMAVERFVSRLATADDVAPSTQNQALSALLFLYREVLGIRLPWMENVVRAKRQRRLPVVLSKGETTAVLRHLLCREAMMAGLLSGSGLRLMACVRLRIKDVDFARNEITVREGKGGGEMHPAQSPAAVAPCA